MNNDLISREMAIDAIIDHIREKFAQRDTPLNYISGLYKAEDIIEILPSAQQTLYGYKVEHLAYIARVMEKEGVTAEYAVRTFDDMSRAIKMIIEEAQQKVEETLNEIFNQQAGGD